MTAGLITAGLAECDGSTTLRRRKAEPVRKLISFGIVAFGAIVGLLSAAADDWATRMVMASVGVLFAVPIAAVLGRKPMTSRKPDLWDDSSEVGMTTSPKALAANYWRDRGHPPFMRPSDADPDRHMFDPDKLG